MWWACPRNWCANCSNGCKIISKRRVVVKKIFFVFFGLMICSAVWAEDFLARKQVKLGEPMPDFALRDLQGNTVELPDLKGKVVMLHFWSAQCPFVVRYESRLQAITGDYGDRGVAVYAIDSNVTETPERIKKEAEKRHLNYPILLDPESKIADQFGAMTTPHVYIIDKEGVLRYEGAVDDQGWGEKDPVTTSYAREALDAVLAGKPVPNPQTKTVGCTVKRKK